MYDFLYNTEEEILRKKFTLELAPAENWSPATADS